MSTNPRIGMATFARFYDAPASEKAKVVQDALLFRAQPKKYRNRAYYGIFRNTLAQTHWANSELSDFEDAIEEIIIKLNREHKKENYQVVGDAYVRYCARQDDLQMFKIPPTTLDIAGLGVLVNPDVGMRRRGDNFALKLWLSAKPPKRSYRQAIQYLMAEAQDRGWQSSLTPGLWDIRREEILPPVQIPRDFSLVIRGQAAAFREMWDAADGLAAEDEPIDLE